jgi:C1A family cysteine protease
MPPVGQQGGEQCCVPFAVGYAARSAEQYYKTGATSYSLSSNIFSPEFMYNQTKYGDCGSGTDIVTTLEFLKSKGICTWQSFPYSSTNGCSLLPTSSQLNEAASYKISSYSAVYKSDITAIKNLLVNKHPLMITVILDNSFTNAGPGFIWKSYTGPGGFGHTLTICGYDDAKNAFKVMNSWGTGWGDSGYSWIDYNFLSQTGSNSAFVMSL